MGAHRARHSAQERTRRMQATHGPRARGGERFAGNVRNVRQMRRCLKSKDLRLNTFE